MKSHSLTRFLGFGAIAVVLAATAPALADPHKNESGHPGKGWHKEHRDDRRDHHKDRDKWRGDDRHVVVIERDRSHWDRSHREVIVRYYDEHRYSCPPGLIETRHGCMPRGQAKKRYVIGQALPRTVVIETLPYDLYRQLPPPPHGYMYRRVDGDVLLIAEGTRKVIDAIVLFSAL